MIILAAAIGRHNELGRESGVPLWDLPDEYGRFREHIKNHPIIMGRKSFDVIGEPLENSLNIVITRKKEYDGKGAIVTHSLQEALEKARQNVGVEKDIFVIGGGEIFNMALPVADKMELSRIAGDFPDAEAFFPEFSTDIWTLVSEEQHPKDKKHAYSFTFEVWVKK